MLRVAVGELSLTIISISLVMIVLAFVASGRGVVVLVTVEVLGFVPVPFLPQFFTLRSVSFIFSPLIALELMCPISRSLISEALSGTNIDNLPRYTMGEMTANGKFEEYSFAAAGGGRYHEISI